MPLVLSAMAEDQPSSTANRSFTQMFPGTVGGFTVTVNRRTDTNATVTLCRFLTNVESRADSTCSDGQDNDCDGLVDMDDIDCKESPPPPSPRPPRPPPKPRRPPPKLRRKSPPPPRPRSRTTTKRDDEEFPYDPAGSAAHCHTCVVMCIVLAALCTVLQYCSSGGTM
ncbi:hypothetical protein PLESTM_001359300 [Pleodorina starrii]|nr:hypothetical protein PLESTM_001359300 [Pleodorina starrii]